MQQKTKIYLNMSVLLFYLISRSGFDFLWRLVSPYYAYLFEIIFVVTAGFFGIQRPKLKICLKDNLLPLLLAIGCGFFIHRMATLAGITVPFNLNSLEIICLLLILAPILEEALFRHTLWNAMQNIFKKPSTILIGTSLLFSLGHLIAFWSVPNQFKTFVLYQTLYVMLLGLAAGWRRHTTGSPLAAVIVHFGFNLGFFAGL